MDHKITEREKEANFGLFCLAVFQELQAMHTGESFMGDKLQVSLWQQEDQSNSIQYVIHRQREDQSPVVFHGSMVFGQSSSVSSQL